MTLFDSLSPEDRARAGVIEAPDGKAIVGPGVAMVQYGSPIGMFSRSPQRLMREAQALYHSNPWVHAAEATVTRAVVGMEWHLEDEGDEEEGEGPSSRLQIAQDLLEKPQEALPISSRRMTRRELWALTSRHMGLCGTAFWYLDQRDAVAGFPLGIVYVNPARVWPAEDQAGNLVGWVLDPKDDTGRGGTPLEIGELVPFYLDPPDFGHLGTGLVEVAGLKARITQLADQHAAFVLSMGGRMAGIVSPKEGVLNADQFQRLVREFRNVAEAPDSAKRTIILDGPVDFKQTAATPTDLDLLELSRMNRDDILAIWGVPPPLAGIPSPAGLNSGESRRYDQAILYQGAVHDRIVSIRETVQYQILDRLQKLGITADLEIEEPEFEDRAPAYDLATKAREIPLTNRERREIVGLDPFGKPEIDEAVWLPVGLTEAYPGAEDGPGEPVAEEEPLLPPGELPPLPPLLPEGKASPRSALVGLRARMDKQNIPAMERSVAAVLREMEEEITGKIRARAEHVARKPGDTFWWDERKWNRRLLAALGPHYQRTADVVFARTHAVLAGGKADPVATAVATLILNRAGARIVSVNRTTRDGILGVLRGTIAEGVAQGLAAAAIGKLIEGLDFRGTKVFDEYRAERIARTEAMFAYNASALESYRDLGVECVEPIDGDQDEECQARLERGAVTLDAALADEDHPNGTLDWVPVLKAAPVVAVQGRAETISEIVRSLTEPPDVVVQPTPVTVHPTPVTIDMEPIARAFEELKASLTPRLVRREAIRDASGRIVEVRESFMEEGSNG